MAVESVLKRVLFSISCLTRRRREHDDRSPRETKGGSVQSAKVSMTGPTLNSGTCIKRELAAFVRFDTVPTCGSDKSIVCESDFSRLRESHTDNVQVLDNIVMMVVVLLFHQTIC